MLLPSLQFITSIHILKTFRRSELLLLNNVFHFYFNVGKGHDTNTQSAPARGAQKQKDTDTGRSPSVSLITTQAPVNGTFYICPYCYLKLPTLETYYRHTQEKHASRYKPGPEQSKRAQQNVCIVAKGKKKLLLPRPAAKEGTNKRTGKGDTQSHQEIYQTDSNNTAAPIVEGSTSQMYKCNFCEFSVSSTVLLLNHVVDCHGATHTKGKPFYGQTCDDCKKIISEEDRTLLECHRHMPDIYSCPVCKQFYPTIFGMVAHARVTHDKLTGVCSGVWCSEPERFSDSILAWRRHITKFHGNFIQSNARCKKCAISIAEEDWVGKEHTHLPKIYICTICQAFFPRLGDLASHVTNAHSPHPYSYACNASKSMECSFADFPNTAAWRDHILTFHKSELTRKCGECVILCAQEKLNRYQSHKHTPAVYPCPICDQIYPSIHYLFCHCVADSTCANKVRQFLDMGRKMIGSLARTEQVKIQDPNTSGLATENPEIQATSTSLDSEECTTGPEQSKSVQQNVQTLATKEGPNKALEKGDIQSHQQFHEADKNSTGPEQSNSVEQNVQTIAKGEENLPLQPIVAMEGSNKGTDSSAVGVSTSAVYECNLCEFSVGSVELLSNHIVENHVVNHSEGQTTSRGSCVEKWCPRERFPNDGEWRKHVQSFHSEFIETCDDCNKVISGEDKELEYNHRHVRGIYTCPECKQFFHTMYTMLAHTAFHDNFVSSTCSGLWCSESAFPTVHAWRNHIVKFHENAMKNNSKCEACSRSIAEEDLVGNEHTHDPKIYTCPICPSFFGSLSALIAHTTVSHKPKPDSYPCFVGTSRECSYVDFPDMTSWREHIQNFHETLIKKCGVCVTLCAKDKIRAFEPHKHAGAVYTCSNCSKIFPSIQYLFCHCVASFNCGNMVKQLYDMGKKELALTACDYWKRETQQQKQYRERTWIELMEKQHLIQGHSGQEEVENQPAPEQIKMEDPTSPRMTSLDIRAALLSPDLKESGSSNTGELSQRHISAAGDMESSSKQLIGVERIKIEDPISLATKNPEMNATSLPLSLEESSVPNSTECIPKHESVTVNLDTQTGIEHIKINDPISLAMSSPEIQAISLSIDSQELSATNVLESNPKLEPANEDIDCSTEIIKCNKTWCPESMFPNHDAWRKHVEKFHFHESFIQNCNKCSMIIAEGNASKGKLLKTHDHETAVYTCPICQDFFPNFDRLMSHAHENHEPSKIVYKCGAENSSVCSYASFYNMARWRAHIQVHHRQPIKQQLCEVCKYLCSKEKVDTNEAHKHRTGVYTCPICCEIYPSLQYLFCHSVADAFCSKMIKRSYTDPLKRDSEVLASTCPYCKVYISDSDSVRKAHMRTCSVFRKIVLARKSKRALDKRKDQETRIGASRPCYAHIPTSRCPYCNISQPNIVSVRRAHIKLCKKFHGSEMRKPSVPKIKENQSSKIAGQLISLLKKPVTGENHLKRPILAHTEPSPQRKDNSNEIAQKDVLSTQKVDSGKGNVQHCKVEENKALSHTPNFSETEQTGQNHNSSQGDTETSSEAKSRDKSSLITVSQASAPNYSTGQVYQILCNFCEFSTSSWELLLNHIVESHGRQNTATHLSHDPEENSKIDSTSKTKSSKATVKCSNKRKNREEWRPQPPARQHKRPKLKFCGPLKQNNTKGQTYECTLENSSRKMSCSPEAFASTREWLDHCRNCHVDLLAECKTCINLLQPLITHPWLDVDDAYYTHVHEKEVYSCPFCLTESRNAVFSRLMDLLSHVKSVHAPTGHYYQRNCQIQKTHQSGQHSSEQTVGNNKGPNGSHDGEISVNLVNIMEVLKLTNSQKEIYQNCSICIGIVLDQAWTLSGSHVHSSGIYKCPFCNALYARLSHVMRHVQRQHFFQQKHMKITSCDECRTLLTAPATLTIHEELHTHSPSLFRCRMCLHVSFSFPELSAHVRSTHITHLGNSEMSTMEIWVCNHCLKVFQAGEILSIHLLANQCHRENIVPIKGKPRAINDPVVEFNQCEACNLNVPSYLDDVHKKWHSFRDEFSCGMCANLKNLQDNSLLIFRSRDLTGMIAHIKTHTCERATCSRNAFRFTHHWFNHCKIFHTDLLAKCDTCLKLLKRVNSDPWQDLDDSFYTHTHTKEIYRCPFCPGLHDVLHETFKDLVDHVKIVHTIVKRSRKRRRTSKKNRSYTFWTKEKESFLLELQEEIWADKTLKGHRVTELWKRFNAVYKTTLSEQSLYVHLHQLGGLPQKKYQRFWTKEKETFLLGLQKEIWADETLVGCRRKELRKRYAEKFETNITEASLYLHLQKLNTIKSASNVNTVPGKSRIGKKRTLMGGQTGERAQPAKHAKRSRKATGRNEYWTDEKDQFLFELQKEIWASESLRGCRRSELRKRYVAKFGTNISENALYFHLQRMHKAKFGSKVRVRDTPRRPVLKRRKPRARWTKEKDSALLEMYHDIWSDERYFGNRRTELMKRYTEQFGPGISQHSLDNALSRIHRASIFSRISQK